MIFCCWQFLEHVLGWASFHLGSFIHLFFNCCCLYILQTNALLDFFFFLGASLFNSIIDIVCVANVVKQVFLFSDLGFSVFLTDATEIKIT